jgi:hypothetical protein
MAAESHESGGWPPGLAERVKTAFIGDRPECQ